MNPFQFKIPARQRSCIECNKRFEDNDQIFSTVEGEEEAPLRKDYCHNCFNEALCGENIWGHWHIELKREKKVLTPDERAMEIFLSAYKNEDLEYLFFVAQYLRRKKQLVLRSEIKKENRLFFEDPKTSEIYALVKKDVPLSDVNKLKVQFINELEHSNS